jgi:tRNA threonylcarbamoyl adenosine modification protein (Sua5/YciO/YrdC/YwlC family)
VLATDKSAKALAVAARNVSTLGLEGIVELTRADLLAGVPDDSLHLVVSNPPYVSAGDLDLLSPDIRLFEPLAALEGGPDGLAVIRRLVPDAARALRPGGTLLLEVGDGQAAAVEELVRKAGFATVGVQKDLSGKDRIVEATLPGVFSMAAQDLEEERHTTLAHALEAGAIIGVPTDTVYGLAARWDSGAGVSALFAAKGRSEEQIVGVLFASVEDVARALPDLDDSAIRVMGALLPGPYTFVVATEVPRVPLVGTADSLGVRVPDHPALLELLGAVGTPLAATSANRTGDRDAATLADVDPAVLSYCTAAFLDPGPEGSPGKASTVVDLRPLAAGATPEVLREGAVPAAQVLADIADLRL